MNTQKFLIIGLIVFGLQCQTTVPNTTTTTNTTNTTTTTNSTTVAVTTNCAPLAGLTAFGLVSQNATLANGTCTGYFNTGGACATPASVAALLASRSASLSQVAQDAYNFTGLYLVANSYFFNVNKGSLTSLSGTSIWASLGNWFKSLWSNINSFYGLALNWVQTLFNNGKNAINPCFQAYANVTNGMFCVFAANTNMSATAVPSTTNAWSLLADPNIHSNLDSCLPLFDNYCILNYGISTSQTSSPFNTTQNWADGAIPSTICTTLQALNGVTNATAVLQRRSIVLNYVRTDAVPFVWSSANIALLSAFLNRDPLTLPATFTPAAFSANGARLQFSPQTGITTDYILAGVNSGQAAGNYNAVTTSSAWVNGFSVMVLFLLTMFMKF